MRFKLLDKNKAATFHIVSSDEAEQVSSQICCIY